VKNEINNAARLLSKNREFCNTFDAFYHEEYDKAKNCTSMSVIVAKALVKAADVTERLSRGAL
jgi:hypothetical protein